MNLLTAQLKGNNEKGLLKLQNLGLTSLPEISDDLKPFCVKIIAINLEGNNFVSTGDCLKWLLDFKNVEVILWKVDLSDDEMEVLVDFDNLKLFDTLPVDGSESEPEAILARPRYLGLSEPFDVAEQGQFSLPRGQAEAVSPVPLRQVSFDALSVLNLSNKPQAEVLKALQQADGLLYLRLNNCNLTAFPVFDGADQILYLDVRNNNNLTPANYDLYSSLKFLRTDENLSEEDFINDTLVFINGMNLSSGVDDNSLVAEIEAMFKPQAELAPQFVNPEVSTSNPQFEAAARKPMFQQMNVALSQLKTDVQPNLNPQDLQKSDVAPEGPKSMTSNVVLSELKESADEVVDCAKFAANSRAFFLKVNVSEVEINELLSQYVRPAYDLSVYEGPLPKIVNKEKIECLKLGTISDMTASSLDMFQKLQILNLTDEVLLFELAEHLPNLEKLNDDLINSTYQDQYEADFANLRKTQAPVDKTQKGAEIAPKVAKTAPLPPVSPVVDRPSFAQAQRIVTATFTSYIQNQQSVADLDDVFSSLPETVTYVNLQGIGIVSMPLPPVICKIRCIDVRRNPQLEFMEDYQDLEMFDSLEYLFVDDALFAKIDEKMLRNVVPKLKFINGKGPVPFVEFPVPQGLNYFDQVKSAGQKPIVKKDIPIFTQSLLIDFSNRGYTIEEIVLSLSGFRCDSKAIGLQLTGNEIDSVAQLCNLPEYFQQNIVQLSLTNTGIVGTDEALVELLTIFPRIVELNADFEPIERKLLDTILQLNPCQLCQLNDENFKKYQLTFAEVVRPTISSVEQEEDEEARELFDQLVGGQQGANSEPNADDFRLTGLKISKNGRETTIDEMRPVSREAVTSLLPEIYRQIYSKNPPRRVETFQFVENDYQIEEVTVKNELQSALTQFREEMAKVLADSPVCESNFQRAFNEKLAELNIQKLNLPKATIVSLPDLEPIESVSAGNKLAFAVQKIQEFQQRFQNLAVECTNESTVFTKNLDKEPNLLKMEATCQALANTIQLVKEESSTTKAQKQQIYDVYYKFMGIVHNIKQRLAFVKNQQFMLHDLAKLRCAGSRAMVTQGNFTMETTVPRLNLQSPMQVYRTFQQAIGLYKKRNAPLSQFIDYFNNQFFQVQYGSKFANTKRQIFYESIKQGLNVSPVVQLISQLLQHNMIEFFVAEQEKIRTVVTDLLIGAIYEVTGEPDLLQTEIESRLLQFQVKVPQAFCNAALSVLDEETDRDMNMDELEAKVLLWKLAREIQEDE